jgi:acyl dehydratase
MTGTLQSRIGTVEAIGSHHFEAEEIVRFARKYDPQPFHIDAEAARRSHFGALCASGWHTISAWMARNVASPMALPDDVESFGPLSGFEGLTWLRPVYVGDTISYSRSIAELRPDAEHPDRATVVLRAEGHNQNGDKVVECNLTADVRLKPS